MILSVNDGLCDNACREPHTKSHGKSRRKPNLLGIDGTHVGTTHTKAVAPDEMGVEAVRCVAGAPSLPGDGPGRVVWDPDAIWETADSGDLGHPWRGGNASSRAHEVLGASLRFRCGSGLCFGLKLWRYPPQWESARRGRPTTGVDRLCRRMACDGRRLAK
ncbi:MAG: hypothetical protein NUW12_02735 [Firmicutes bacterium]|jgi:hypothetical protein|nr:hypothetical protein [Bacillota bacterium]MDH7494638.1 hypothetical protein [Bacillota bacterium]